MSKKASTSAAGEGSLAQADHNDAIEPETIEEDQAGQPWIEDNEEEEEEAWNDEGNGDKPDEMLQEDEAVNQFEEDAYGE